MTTLLLVRHGETVANANQILQGQTQGELNEKGVAQAEKLARELSDTPIDAFISSDLQRAEHTCSIIAAPHNKPFRTTQHALYQHLTLARTRLGRLHWRIYP